MDGLEISYSPVRDCWRLMWGSHLLDTGTKEQMEQRKSELLSNHVNPYRVAEVLYAR